MDHSKLIESFKLQIEQLDKSIYLLSMVSQRLADTPDSDVISHNNKAISQLICARNNLEYSLKTLQTNQNTFVR